MGDASAYPPEQLNLPPNLADTQSTREAFSRYLAEITYMDGQVGELIHTLDLTAHVKDTLVLFTSEQGSQFPGCKWTNYDTGLHTALIARQPGKIQAGRRTGALVQYADVLPTLIEWTGGTPSSQEYDGHSFLKVLRGEKATHRRYVYGVHNNLPEGPRYPIRTISDGRYRYIRNFLPEEIYIEKHLMGWSGEGDLNNPYWATGIREAWADPRTYQLTKRYLHRPAEELYHTAADPFELTNLVNQASLLTLKARFAAELDEWMTRQGDPGAPEDTFDALEAARRGEHLYGRSTAP